MTSPRAKSEAEKSKKKPAKTLVKDSTNPKAKQSKKKPAKTLVKDTTNPKAKQSKTCNGDSSNVRLSTTDSERKATTKKPDRKLKREQSANGIDDKNYENKFPMERVRRIIRGDDSEIRVTNEAVFLVNKAAEKFLETFSGESHACCVEDRKKSLSYNHLSSAVSKYTRYDFLSDFVPVKVKAQDALAEMRSVEPEEEA